MGIMEFGGTSYHIDNKLLKFWKKYSLEYIDHTNTDRFYIVDGRERSGKSTWAIQQACALDPSLKDLKVFLSRICFSPEDFDRACKEVRNGVIIFDEAFRGLSARSALSKTNRKLITTLMEMGQNNNIVFLILPSFFMLDTYPAMLRSNALFNIYIDKKTGKRTFRGFNYNDKNRIYQQGVRKGWNYFMRTKFKGRFYENREHTKFPGGKRFYNAYEAKKRRALRDRKDEIEKVKEDKYMIQRDLIIKGLYKDYLPMYTKVARWLNKHGIKISDDTIRNIIKNTGKDGEKPKTE